MRIPELTDWALSIDDLSVRRGYGANSVRAVDGVSAQLPFGAALVIAGSTGSGRTSLLAALAGVRDKRARIIGGESTVCGISARHPGRARSVLTYRVGYMAQDAGPNFDPDRTIGEIIAAPIVMRDPRTIGRALEVRVSKLLDEVRLPLGVMGRFPHELSAGMRQRVALARALVLDPRLLVADEPLAGIDVEVRHVVRDAILRRRDEWGMAALIATNDVAFAEEIGAHRLVMREGCVTASAEPGADPVVTPGEEDTRAFLVR
ncbi:ATP-binding cassette domain-containing protein [Microbacterium amylolyticum]|uniref:Peptide/nickel transport system ATP-binding protein n=1 Tax=Microbacterium amylolyticum TaxID=936337 RepID=A0ABS4ZF24_9MICO|nr:ATP-binding cassette domain-containing protein [Microbacterium amylolyticum]MBP2435633.1 peptide/nickel transport system ATP-binding protein [Microbacterium amylolyticum]